jgi:hypothetical protein
MGATYQKFRETKTLPPITAALLVITFLEARLVILSFDAPSHRHWAVKIEPEILCFIGPF